ncbi:MAG: helix-turn-helix domain-containing protein [Acidobacteria bacterium]|nr:helix-turn-helix domain-containing protein [Acidobacteriota bacterium]
MTTQSAEIVRFDEACQMLRVSKPTLSRIIAGKIQGVKPLSCIRIGRLRLFRRETLTAWSLENQR